MAVATQKFRGRFTEAFQENRRAVDLDPLNGDSWESLAETEFYAGQLDQAATDARKALELSPDVFPGHMLSSKIYLLQGRPEAALPEIAHLRYDYQRAVLYAMAYHAIGPQKESDTALSLLLAN